MIQVKHRNMLVQLLLMLVTCGLYAPYWYFMTTTELCIVNKKQGENVFLYTIFFIIPILHILAWYKQAELFEETSQGELNRWVMLLIWFLFAPLAWFLIQRKLNAIADEAVKALQAH